MKTKGRREHKKGLALYYAKAETFQDMWTGEDQVRNALVDVVDLRAWKKEVGMEFTHPIIDDDFVKTKRYQDFCDYMNPKLAQNSSMSVEQVTLLWHMFKEK